MIAAAVIDALVAAGATAEMIAAAIKADLALEEAKLAAKRAKNAQRMRTVRERARTAAHSDAQTRTAADPPNVPPHPPKYTPQGSAPSERPTVVGEDPRATLFREGKTLLASFGVAEKRTGALLGQWLKQRDDPEGLLAAIRFARDQNVAEPVAYVSTVFHGNAHGKRPPTLASAADDLITRAENFERESRARSVDRSG